MTAKHNILQNPIHKSHRFEPFRQWFDLNQSGNLILLGVSVCILILLPSLFFFATELEVWRFGVILLVLGGIWASVYWIVNHRSEEPQIRMTLLWIGALLILSEIITIISFGQFPRLLHIFVPVIGVFYLPVRGSIAVTLGTAIWVITSVALFGTILDQSPILKILPLIVIYLISHTLAYTWLQERRASLESKRLLRELAESNNQLTRYAAEATQLATVRERSRIAREIHDSLGHSLTIVGVQLEKAIAFDQVDRETAGAALRAAKQLADQALVDVRQSVGTLREMDDEFTLHGALNALAQNVEQGGLSVDFRWRGDEAGLSEQQLLTLFRAAQEGLTNVQRHAQAENVMIDVALDAETAELQLTDDGIGIDKSKIKNGRYGLEGLRERVELVQGVMRLDRIPAGGTQLVVTLPRGEIL